MLSDRIRPDVEAAPWIIEEVKKLEAENAKLKDAAKNLLWYVEQLEQVVYVPSGESEHEYVEAARAALGETND